MPSPLTWVESPWFATVVFSTHTGLAGMRRAAVGAEGLHRNTVARSTRQRHHLVTARLELS